MKYNQRIIIGGATALTGLSLIVGGMISRHIHERNKVYDPISFHEKTISDLSDTTHNASNIYEGLIKWGFVTTMGSLSNMIFIKPRKRESYLLIKD